MYINENEYYNRIVAAVENLVDGSWEQIVVRIWKDEYQSSVGVYCKINNAFKSIGDYFSIGEMSLQEYRAINQELRVIADDMQKELYENRKEIWSCMVFSLMLNREYDIEYSYENFPENEFIENLNWEYKKLGIVPNEANMKYLNV